MYNFILKKYSDTQIYNLAKYVRLFFLIENGMRILPKTIPFIPAHPAQESSKLKYPLDIYFFNLWKK